MSEYKRLYRSNDRIYSIESGLCRADVVHSLLWNHPLPRALAHHAGKTQFFVIHQEIAWHKSAT